MWQPPRTQILIQFSNSRRSQRSAAPVLCFQARESLHPVFLLPSHEGDGAPGGARELARLPSPACEAGVITPSFRDPIFSEGVGVPGRAGPCEEPCASRRSIAMSLSDIAPRSVMAS